MPGLFIFGFQQALHGRPDTQPHVAGLGLIVALELLDAQIDLGQSISPVAVYHPLSRLPDFVIRSHEKDPRNLFIEFNLA